MMKKLKSCLFKTQIFLSVLLLAGLIGCPNNVNKTEQVTITVKGDANVVLGSTTSIKVNKGAKWQTVKDNAAIKAVTFQKGFELDVWKLSDASGTALTDGYTFASDSVVFAVSKSASITITVKGDGNAILGSTTSIKADKGAKWQDIKKNAAIKAVTFKKGFVLDVWKLNDASGAALTDGHVFDADSVVFAVSKNSPPAKQVTITVKGDGNAILGSKTSIKVDKGTSWKDVKSDDAITKVTFKKGFMLNAWKLNNETGDALHDAYLFNDDSVVFAVSKSENITITVKGDDHIILGAKTSIEVPRGTKWEVVKKDPAITAVKAADGWKFGGWHLGNATGMALEGKDWFDFKEDTVVFAVSKNENNTTPANKVTITITGDAHVTIHENSTVIDKGKKLGDGGGDDVRSEITGSVDIEDGWDIHNIRLDGASGKVLDENYVFNENVTVYIETVEQADQDDVFVTDGNGKIVGLNVEKSDLPETIKIPDLLENKKVIAIGKDIFSQADKIKTVDMSECTSLKIIEENAFALCKNLATVKFPASLTEIQKNAFYKTNLTGVLDFSKCALSKLSGFKNCSNVTEIKLPASVKEIGEEAFQQCTGLNNTLDLSVCTALTKISKKAFHGCSKITKVKFPVSLTEIEGNAFEAAFGDCTSIEGTLDISNCTNLKSISGFSNCKKITEIKLPNDVTEIREAAFAGCGLQNTLDLEKYSKLVKVAGFATTKITSIKLPNSVKEISKSAFSHCAELTGELDLSSCTSLEVIGGEAFIHCTKITSVKFPASLKEMKTAKGLFGGFGLGTFTGCKVLKKVDFSACTELKKINAQAFSGCIAINEIKLPTGITEIEDKAFSSCAEIAVLNLSSCNQLKKIGKDAFYDCKKAEITLGTSVNSIGDGAFGDKASNCVKKVKVPNDAIKQLVKNSGCPESNIEVISSGSGS